MFCLAKSFSKGTFNQSNFLVTLKDMGKDFEIWRFVKDIWVVWKGKSSLYEFEIGEGGPVAREDLALLVSTWVNSCLVVLHFFFGRKNEKQV